MGIIKVDVSHYTEAIKVTEGGHLDSYPDLTGSGPVSEKSIKGQAISHSVGYVSALPLVSLSSMSI